MLSWSRGFSRLIQTQHATKHWAFMNYTKWIMAEFLINGISWDQQFDCVCCWTQWYDHPIKVQKHPRTKCVASFCPTNPNRMEESQTLTSWLKCFKGNWCHVPCQQTQTTTNYIICQNHIQLWLEDLWHLFSGWWVFKPSEKYSSNWIISPQVGMKKNTNFWNHHLASK